MAEISPRWDASVTMAEAERGMVRAARACALVAVAALVACTPEPTAPAPVRDSAVESIMASASRALNPPRSPISSVPPTRVPTAANYFISSGWQFAHAQNHCPFPAKTGMCITIEGCEVRKSEARVWLRATGADTFDDHPGGSERYVEFLAKIRIEDRSTLGVGLVRYGSFLTTEATYFGGARMPGAMSFFEQGLPIALDHAPQTIYRCTVAWGIYRTSSQMSPNIKGAVDNFGHIIAT